MGENSLGVGAAFFATIFCFRPMSVHRLLVEVLREGLEPSTYRLKAGYSTD